MHWLCRRGWFGPGSIDDRLKAAHRAAKSFARAEGYYVDLPKWSRENFGLEKGGLAQFPGKAAVVAFGLRFAQRRP